MRDDLSDILLTIDIDTWKAVRSAPPHRPPWRRCAGLGDQAGDGRFD